MNRNPSPRSSHPARRSPAPSPAARRARERARARARRAAQLRALLFALLLILLAALTAVGVSRCSDSSRPTLPPVTSGGETAAPLDGETTGETAPPRDTDTGTSPPVTTEPPQTEPAGPSFVFDIPEAVQSRYLLLMELESGTVLAERNADAVAYPASITKTMTVLAAIEELEDLSGTTTITADLINRLVAAEASRAGFEPGEVVTAKDMLYAAMLPSGADGSVGLAELISGSEEAFAALMTDKAKALGMTKTNFANVTGLHHPDHYSTCHDLAKLLRYALKNEAFREIFTTKHYQSSPTNKHANGIWMSSSMFRNLELEMLQRSYFLGGKTGFTEEAGLCLASLATWEGKEYLLITMGAGDGTNSPRWQVRDAVAVFDALFDTIS